MKFQNVVTGALWHHIMENDHLAYGLDAVLRDSKFESRAKRVTGHIANKVIEAYDGHLHNFVKDVMGFDPTATLWRECIDLYAIVQQAADDAGIVLGGWPTEDKCGSTLANTYINGASDFNPMACEPVPDDIDFAELAEAALSTSNGPTGAGDTTTMSNSTDIKTAVEITTSINGVNYLHMSLDNFLSTIKRLTDQIKTLDDANINSSAVSAQITALQSQRTDIIGLMDASCADPQVVVERLYDNGPVQTTIFVDGCVHKNLTLDQYIAAIARRNDAAGVLEDTDIRSTAIASRINTLRGDVDSIAKLMDEVHTPEVVAVDTGS